MWSLYDSLPESHFQVTGRIHGAPTTTQYANTMKSVSAEPKLPRLPPISATIRAVAKASKKDTIQRMTTLPPCHFLIAMCTKIGTETERCTGTWEKHGAKGAGPDARSISPHVDPGTGDQVVEGEK